MWLYSEPGVGTSVKVYLPLVETPVAPREEPPSEPSRGHETVLVVEDDVMVRELAVQALAELAYRVNAAGDGIEALKRLDELRGRSI